ncbi:MAG: hypothetical protein LAT62_13315 [Natronospirillum sp.]|uniref:hypothetical protein n=1 Tax=Natronospirillum sp. TaxID=2812955 RepID=UPI0025DF727C|nr:hypothetical protein [Natronospirillum sp.]MCH8552912.1 hypothetical protein [Natronospirillum sp.]
MTVENNRLLLEIEKRRRDINREIMNPQIPELSLEDLDPVLKLAARARLAYVQELMDIASMVGEAGPSIEQIEQLRNLRITYEETRSAVNALETLIQRDYLDVKRR